MESGEARDGREGTAAAAAGCLVAAAAAATGFAVWSAFVPSGTAGGFEGRRDWSLLYIELPGMVGGFPVIALLTWSLTRAVFRGRARRRTRAVVTAAVVGLTLLLLSWACGAWLEHRAGRTATGSGPVTGAGPASAPAGVAEPPPQAVPASTR